MTQLEIIRFLIENNTESFSIREISKKLNIAYKLVHKNIQLLYQQDIINIKTVGKSSQISFKFVLNPIVYDVEIQRKNEILKNKNIKILYQELKQIESPFFIALLFGSFVKKTNNKNSDIDLCVIHEDEKILKTIYSKLKLLPIDIEIHEFNSEEFKSMLKTTQFNIGHEVKNNYIVLKGVENFYHILENGGQKSSGG